MKVMPINNYYSNNSSNTKVNFKSKKMLINAGKLAANLVTNPTLTTAVATAVVIKKIDDIVKNAFDNFNPPPPPSSSLVKYED